jgi:hypothetical protein
MTPEKAIHPVNHGLLASDKAPGDHCVSKLLGITMDDFWNVLLECKLAKKRGNKNVIEKLRTKQFITDNGLTGILLDGESNKQPTTASVLLNMTCRRRINGKAK